MKSEEDFKQMKKDLEEYKSKLNISNFLYQIRSVLHSKYKYKYPYKVPVEDLITTAVQDLYSIYGKFESTTGEELNEALTKDVYGLIDYEVRDGFFQMKEYKPISLKFRTSGKIIVENDLRDFYGDNSDEFYVNTIHGQIGTTLDYYEKGMLHAYVGNSCPTLYLSKEDGVIQIGVKYDRDGDKIILPNDSYEELTSVDTALWWYSIADLEQFQKQFPEVDVSTFEVVEVPEGEYLLEHTYGVTTYEDGGVYATLTKQS